MSEPRESAASSGRAVREGAPAAAAPSTQDAPRAHADRLWIEPRERPPNKSLVGQMVGSYRVTRLLGEGGVGAVYLGEHPLVQSRVAIKVLHDDHARSSEMVRRFVTEARAANLIPSPHVVRISDFGQLEDGREYAVMEYLEGRSLGDILEVEKSLDVRRALGLLRQTADGMAVAHANGIIHRDLKPENLFVQVDPAKGEFVRILDFGIAKLTSGFARDAKVTAAGVFVGTPLYCSPEQMSAREVGPASDIYSLGVIAFELVTGKPLFDGDCMDVLMQKAKGADEALRALPEGLPAELKRLITQMLRHRPSARPASMTLVAERLTAIARELDAQALLPAPAPRRLARLPSRRALLLTVFSATLLLVGIWAVSGSESPGSRGFNDQPRVEKADVAHPESRPPEPPSAAVNPASPVSAAPDAAPAVPPPARKTAAARSDKRQEAGTNARRGSAARQRRGAAGERLGTLVDPFAQ